MNAEYILRHFMRDLETGWAEEYYRFNDESECVGLRCSKGEIADDWIRAQFGSSSTADFAKEILSKNNEWRSYI